MKDVHVSLHNIRSCICSKCSCFPGKWRELAHGDMPGLFCAHGKSKLDIEQKPCICSKCLVQHEHELGDRTHYCINGKPVPE